jgi:hypothetical protein
MSPDLLATHSECTATSLISVGNTHDRYILTFKTSLHTKAEDIPGWPLLQPNFHTASCSTGKVWKPCLQITSQSSGKAPHCFKLLARSISQAHGGGSSQVPDDFEAMLSFCHNEHGSTRDQSVSILSVFAILLVISRFPLWAKQLNQALHVHHSEAGRSHVGRFR